MTIAQYLNSLTLDGKSIVWGRNFLSQQQLDKAGGDPYVVFRLGNVWRGFRMHQGQILDQEIQLLVFQEPTRLDTVPSATKIQALWNALLEAPNHVDEGMYGRSIIALEYIGGLAPSLAERSSGLSGVVRFRERFGVALQPKAGG